MNRLVADETVTHGGSLYLVRCNEARLYGCKHIVNTTLRKKRADLEKLYPRDLEKNVCDLGKTLASHLEKYPFLDTTLGKIGP